MYQAYYDHERKIYRVGFTLDGETRDCFGAISEIVAITQADLLNRMRNLYK